MCTTHNSAPVLPVQCVHCRLGVCLLAGGASKKGTVNKYGRVCNRGTALLRNFRCAERCCSRRTSLCRIDITYEPRATGTILVPRSYLTNRGEGAREDSRDTMEGSAIDARWSSAGRCTSHYDELLVAHQHLARDVCFFPVFLRARCISSGWLRKVHVARCGRMKRPQLPSSGQRPFTSGQRPRNGHQIWPPAGGRGAPAAAADRN
jgi:hypothetical protein